jgi:hypothetical protein
MAGEVNQVTPGWHEGQRPAEPRLADQRLSPGFAAASDASTCPLCGASLAGRHCCLVCPDCGYTEDCTDLFPA